VDVKLGELERRLGIEILEASVERVVGRMPVAGNRQTYGRLHGGATMALGETLGSLAATLHGAANSKAAVGVDVNTTHHRSVHQGYVTGTATPLHLGSRLTTHEVALEDDAGRRIATVRITNMLVTPVEDADT
jgi:uncharacterized protein (TIGR00369 family)